MFYIDGGFRETDSPEKLLWSAVLIQACQDSLIVCRRPQDKEIKGAAIRWLNSDSKGVGSLMWICEVLDLDSNRIKSNIFLLGSSRVISSNQTKLMKRLAK